MFRNLCLWDNEQCWLISLPSALKMLHELESIINTHWLNDVCLLLAVAGFKRKGFLCDLHTRLMTRLEIKISNKRVEEPSLQKCGCKSNSFNFKIVPTDLSLQGAYLKRVMQPS